MTRYTNTLYRQVVEQIAARHVQATPPTRSETAGRHAWTLLAKAREARREASRATSHRDAEFALFACREYIRMARRANHQSIRARETPRRWTPPVLRELETAA